MLISLPCLPPLVAVLAAGAALIAYRREIQDALERFNHGGPRPPTGLLPARDFLPLRKRRSKSRNSHDYAITADL